MASDINIFFLLLSGSEMEVLPLYLHIVYFSVLNFWRKFTSYEIIDLKLLKIAIKLHKRNIL